MKIKWIIALSALAMLGCQRQDAPVQSDSNAASPPAVPAPVDPAAQAAIKNSVGYTLASISLWNGHLPTDHPLVTKLNQQLNALQTLTGVTVSDISDMTYTTLKMIRGAGQTANPDELLDMLQQVLTNDKDDMAHVPHKALIANKLTEYEVTRTDAHLSHSDAVKYILNMQQTVQSQAFKDQANKTMNQ